MEMPQATVSRNWLWLSVNIAALAPLLWTICLVSAAPPLRTPLIFVEGAPQHMLLFTGKAALVFLVLSLCCTPAARLLGWQAAITVRKALGLWGFGFALCHSLLFLGGKEIFYTLHAWYSIWEQLSPSLLLGMTKTPFARWGAMALILLIPLALTSNRIAMRWLGRNWKRLHRLVYLAVPLALLHYWQREAFLNVIWNASERPDYRQPLFFTILVGLLLLVRIPFVRHFLLRLAHRLPSPKSVNQASR